MSASTEQLRLWRRVLGDLHIEMDASRTAADAAEKLAGGKYELVAVDYDSVPGSAGLLIAVRSAPTSHHAVVFALVNSACRMRHVAGFGANFVLSQPVAADWIARCLRAAHGSMLADQRRYFRHPVDIPVVIECGSQRLGGRITNLSEGGIGLRVRGIPAHVTKLRLTFVLPGTNSTIEAGAMLAWADGESHAGARFENMLPSKRAALRRWLAERFADVADSVIAAVR